MQTAWGTVLRQATPTAFVSLLLLPVLSFAAQNTAVRAPAISENQVVRTIYLHNIASQNDLNDIQTALRSMLRNAAFYGVASQNAIEFRGTPEDFQAAQKIVTDLDKPRKTYRLTYTITSSGYGKPSQSQTFTLLARLGETADMDLSSRVPYVTGSPNGEMPKGSVNYQWQYANIGLQIRATLQGSSGNLVLQDKIEQSGTIQPKSGSDAPAPTLNHAVLSNATAIAEGKAAVLGSIDVPGTSVHERIEVGVTPAP